MQSDKIAEAETVTKIKHRCLRELYVRISDVDAISTTLACGLVCASEILDYFHEGDIKQQTVQKRKTIAMTDAEFIVLFRGYDNKLRLSTSNRLAKFVVTPEFRAMTKEMESALSQTLLEEPQRRLWDRSPCTRVAALIAFCRDGNSAQCLSAVCGGVVLADERRCDDLRCRLEHGNAAIETIFMTTAIESLASCFCIS
jgi:hypothetical protein